MLIAPSILSFDYSKFNEQINIINKETSWIHFDVMDGHFVPNLSFGPDILKVFRKNSSSFMDVHLMVTNPKDICDAFIVAGADGITFHLEAMHSIEETIELINYLKSKYIRIGISIKPKTSPELLDEILKYVDLVLVMSVEPGYGGQKFMENALEKIDYLKRYRDSHKYNFVIEVDGGVNDKNARLLKEVGTDIIVVGSYLFKGDIKSNIDLLKNV